jgi:hypothetical protein
MRDSLDWHQMAAVLMLGPRQSLLLSFLGICGK